MCRGAAHASITLPDPVRRGPSLPGTSGVSDCSTMRGALLPRINRLADFDVAGLKIVSCRNAGTSVGAGATKMDTVTVGRRGEPSVAARLRPFGNNGLPSGSGSAAESSCVIPRVGPANGAEGRCVKQAFVCRRFRLWLPHG